MTIATFAAAINTAFANGRGTLAQSLNGVINASATQTLLPKVGNTVIAYDDNYAYLTTTQGVANVTGNFYTNATVNGVGYSSPALNTFVENFGLTNANSTGVFVKFATPFTTNAYGISLAVNAAGTNAYYTTVNTTGITLFASTAANATISYFVKGI